MNRSGLLLVLFVVLVGCSEPDPPPSFEVKAFKQGDQVEFEADAGEVRFDIRSQSGIGSAKVELTGGQWPGRIVFRVHTKGLESFKLSYPDTIIEVALQSGSDGKVLRSAMQIGKELQPAGEGTAFYMPLEIDEAENWFEIQAPSDFHELKPGHFQIDWVDFFR